MASGTIEVDIRGIPEVVAELERAKEAISLLPTPTAQAAKHGETPDVTANGFGSNLWDLPTLIGASTPPPSTAGSPSSDGPHPAPPSPAPTDDPDCLPLSWNG